MSRPFPSRSPEARRASYERNIETIRARYHRQKDTVQYARKVLSREMGVSVTEIPDALAEAKLLYLQILRTVRLRERNELPPLLAKEYSEGRTVKQLAKEHGLDGNRVAQILKSCGIKLKSRSTCKRGHDMTEANTAWTPQGWRRCRKCACILTKASAERKKLRERH